LIVCHRLLDVSDFLTVPRGGITLRC
jgi:hypothetical protein